MDSLIVNPDERIRPSEVEPEFGAGLCEKRLRQLRWLGDGPAYTKAGKGTRARVYYKRADIAEWLDRHRIDPAEAEPSQPTNA